MTHNFQHDWISLDDGNIFQDYLLLLLFFSLFVWAKFLVLERKKRKKKTRKTCPTHKMVNYLV